MVYTLLLTDVTFALEMMFNLISKSRARKAVYKIITDNNRRDPSKGATRVVHKQSKKTPITCVETVESLHEAVLSVQIARAVRHDNLDVRHDCLCHISKNTIVQSQNMVEGLNNVYPGNCDACECCLMATYMRQPRTSAKESSIKRPLNRVFSDVAGSITTPSFCGAKFFVTLMDEYRAYSMVRFVGHKIWQVKLLSTLLEIWAIISIKMFSHFSDGTEIS